MLLAFHKPWGVVSQFTPDGSPNRTLAEFGFPAGVYPIGRLDADSEGLLLLSDEPSLNQKLLHPRHGHRRVYWVQVERIPTPAALRQLERGVVLGGHATLPCRAWRLEPPPSLPPREPPIRFRKSVPDCWIALELVEGKNRQVRRMTAAVGHPTLRLVRAQIGGFGLGNLAPGRWKVLSSTEYAAALANPATADQLPPEPLPLGVRWQGGQGGATPLSHSRADLPGSKAAAPSAPAAPELCRRTPQATEIFAALQRAYPDAHCELIHRNPLELLVATILSAQCNDKQVNLVTPALFRRYRTAADYAGAALEELEALIQRLGLYRNKAKALQACGRKLAERHGGAVPRSMAELIELDGVGRKTANVVLGNAFGLNVGIVVDTHVARLSARLGLTRQTTPEKIEQDLMQLVPPSQWTLLSHWLIWHGRRRCFARSPDCAGCELGQLCPRVGV